MNWMDGVVPFIVWLCFTVLGWAGLALLWLGLKAVTEETFYKDHTTFHKWAGIVSAVISAYLVFCMVVERGSIK